MAVFTGIDRSLRTISLTLLRAGYPQILLVLLGSLTRQFGKSLAAVDRLTYLSDPKLDYPDVGKVTFCLLIIRSHLSYRAVAEQIRVWGGK